MPDLRFSVESVVPEHSPAGPMLHFSVRVENSAPDELVRSISLNTQVQIQPARRRYTSDEKIALQELFGEPERWANTLRPLLWTTVSVIVPSFQGSTITSLLVPCPSLLNNAAGRYCHALAEGDIPVELLFSGTVFHVSAGVVQVAFIPWSKETFCRVPGATWRELLPQSSDAASAGYAQHQTWEQILEHARALAGRSKP